MLVPCPLPTVIAEAKVEVAVEVEMREPRMRRPLIVVEAREVEEVEVREVVWMVLAEKAPEEVALVPSLVKPVFSTQALPLHLRVEEVAEPAEGA